MEVRGERRDVNPSPDGIDNRGYVPTTLLLHFR